MSRRDLTLLPSRDCRQLGSFDGEHYGDDETMHTWNDIVEDRRAHYSALGAADVIRERTQKHQNLNCCEQR
jgi:hypothetical protein